MDQIKEAVIGMRPDQMKIRSDQACQPRKVVDMVVKIQFVAGLLLERQKGRIITYHLV